MARPFHASKTAPAGAVPLDLLSSRFEDDMKAVNTLILHYMDSPVDLIPNLAAYLIVAGGKRIRPLLTLAAARLHDGDMTRAHGLAAAVEFIHSATLLHDDVVDESDRRRGQDTANLVFGNQASVLVGDFLFSRAFQLMVADGSLEVLKILSDAAATIAEGEVLQLSTTSNLDTTMEDYLKVVQGKTAALFAASCEVGPVIAGAGKEQQAAMAAYGLNLGIAFQIADDALDYEADRALLGKTVGDDFREGKMTAPVILALESAGDEERAFWARTIAGRDIRDGDLGTAQAFLGKGSRIRQSLEIAGNYAEKARRALAPLPAHELRTLLEDLADYAISRQY